MPQLHNTIKVKASPDQAWAVLGDLAAVTTWVPGVTSCEVNGTRRICNGGEIQEEISEYAPERRSYRYAHLQVPLPVRNSRGTFTVYPDQAGSLIVWDAEFEVLDPAQEADVTRMIGGYYKQTLESLRQQIE